MAKKTQASDGTIVLPKAPAIPRVHLGMTLALYNKQIATSMALWTEDFKYGFQCHIKWPDRDDVFDDVYRAMASSRETVRAVGTTESFMWEALGPPTNMIIAAGKFLDRIRDFYGVQDMGLVIEDQSYEQAIGYLLLRSQFEARPWLKLTYLKPLLPESIPKAEDIVNRAYKDAVSRLNGGVSCVRFPAYRSIFLAKRIDQYKASE